VRDEVLAAAREMLALGLTAGTAGNVSGRAADGTVVVTPASLDYREMTGADLVVLSPDGEVLDGERAPSSERALHLAVYAAFPDVRGVVHAHPVHATMFACARRAIPAAVDEFALYVGGDVPCAAYEPSGSAALAREAVRHLADRAAVLLASHGLVAVGTSPRDALHVATVVEQGAHAIWGAAARGGGRGGPPPGAPPPPPVRGHRSHPSRAPVGRSGPNRWRRSPESPGQSPAGPQGRVRRRRPRSASADAVAEAGVEAFAQAEP
jgi:L-fuculose-phosphate aldolase